MRSRHPRVIFVHWSKSAYQTLGEPTTSLDPDDDEWEEPESRERTEPLYPLIKLAGPNRWQQSQWFKPNPDAALPPAVNFIEVAGPVSDDVVPIIFGYDHQCVYVRLDVAKHLRPHLSPTQRLTAVHCDGETIPYLALTDPEPEVWLPEEWPRTPCADRSAPEFYDGATLISPIFPDTFDPQWGVHFVGRYSNFFLDMVVWRSLCKAIPGVAHWLATMRIVVDDDLD